MHFPLAESPCWLQLLLVQDQMIWKPQKDKPARGMGECLKFVDSHNKDIVQNFYLR